MKKVYGLFEETANLTKLGSLQMHLNPEEFNIMWRHCDVFSNLITDYVGIFLQEKRDSHLILRNWADIKSSVSYLSNELMENALKFRDGGEISIIMDIITTQLVLSVTNIIHKSKVARFQDLLEYYSSKPVDELLIETMEKNAVEMNSSSSIGLLTIMHDHQAKVAWKFEELKHMRDFIKLTTIARLSIKKD